ncbi:UDP-N-acetylmuramoyl-L-alanyl-D-glutamate--2,6-diaminopimelate ligase [Alkalibacter mobilis]|uniref:UDP-N-acetylmuramoyl-L-alanyl-D-glutamate--2, 6-diaminopimelate ligase n=1 Tax=Alkalibacter mobilis TaxID=2787712 RepID=UPI00189F1E5F|nr:UDP-N-acetylmuramoyl-L-alanyl-D-glutamate--2,6-diaminopimelate ligase [Alkalibacter mobilis]MBF7097125.1 UDP-N-acetylmuramoyl-L-alanyl-D-glutamate--2,6-diaminopimelate ligase [Alkalibacter mobilis]
MILEKLMKNISYTLVQGNVYTDIEDLCYDSRRCVKNSLFFAVAGYEINGNRFIADAVNNGATVVVTDDLSESGIDKLKDSNLTVVSVNNVREVMSAVASMFYDFPSQKIKVIGITGTNGKTTTAFYLKQILEYSGYKTGVIGTMGNICGDVFLESTHTTPESIEIHKILDMMVSENAEYVVMEVSSHALELNRVDHVKFQGSIFTNLTQDHLDFHKDIESYYKAKRKLFDFDQDFCIINVDDDYGFRLKNEIGNIERVVGFGVKDHAEYKIKDIDFKEGTTEFKIEHQDEILNYEMNQIGEYNIFNMCGAILAAKMEDLEETAIKQSVKNVKGVKGRLEIIPSEQKFTIVIDFAHTPDGLENVLKSLKKNLGGRLITVFGCGGNRDKEKRSKMGAISGRLSDFSIITSDNPRREDPDSIIKDIQSGISAVTESYLLITDRKEAIKKAIHMADQGDIILLAGKGHEMVQIIGDEKFPFDEREIAREILNNYDSDDFR